MVPDTTPTPHVLEHAHALLPVGRMQTLRPSVVPLLTLIAHGRADQGLPGIKRQRACSHTVPGCEQPEQIGAGGKTAHLPATHASPTLHSLASSHLAPTPPSTRAICSGGGGGGLGG